MLENPMVIDALWPREKDDHYTDSDLNSLEAFSEDKDIIPDAMALWLRADSLDGDNAQECYENLPSKTQQEILRHYIENKRLEGQFNNWWEVRYREL